MCHYDEFDEFGEPGEHDFGFRMNFSQIEIDLVRLKHAISEREAELNVYYLVPLTSNKAALLLDFMLDQIQSFQMQIQCIKAMIHNPDVNAGLHTAKVAKAYKRSVLDRMDTFQQYVEDEKDT